MPFATRQMDVEGNMLSEISQIKTNSVRSHSYVESKKRNQPTPDKLADTENRLVVAGGRSGG